MFTQEGFMQLLWSVPIRAVRRSARHGVVLLALLTNAALSRAAVILQVSEPETHGVIVRTSSSDQAFASAELPGKTATASHDGVEASLTQNGPEMSSCSRNPDFCHLLWPEPLTKTPAESLSPS